MIKRSIRDLHSNLPMPPKFCEVIIEGNEVYLEQKIEKKFKRIAWEDVVYQVEAAKSANQ